MNAKNDKTTTSGEQSQRPESESMNAMQDMMAKLLDPIVQPKFYTKKTLERRIDDAMHATEYSAALADIRETLHGWASGNHSETCLLHIDEIVKDVGK